MTTEIRSGPAAEAEAPEPHSAARATVSPWELWLLALVVLALTWAVWRLIGVGLVLGHDEAVYATRARSWLEHTSTLSWAAHRSPGLPVLAVPILALGGGPSQLRAIGLLCAIALVIGVWVLARRLGGPTAGAIAAAVIAFTPPLLAHAALFLTDLPGAALVVWLVVVVGAAVRRPQGPGPGLLWAAPLVAGAIYLRLGAALPLGLVAVGAVLLWPRSVIAGWRWILATAGLTLLLLWFHIAGAIEAFGTPWGRILYTSSLTRADQPGAALLQYLREMPAALAGVPTGILMIVGLVAAPAVAVSLRRRSGPARLAVLAWLVGAGHLAGMGVSSNYEVRFVFVSIALLVVLGAAAVAALVRWALPSQARTVAVAAAAAVVVFGLVSTTNRLVTERRAAAARYETMELAAAEIIDRAEGADCAVVTSYVPQVEWLTGCDVVAFGDPPLALAAEHLTTSEPFVLLLRDGKRQPTGAELDALLDQVEPVASWERSEGLIGAAWLYRVR